MKCLLCGGAELVDDTRDVTYTYQGKMTIIPSVTGEFCSACDEVILRNPHCDRYMDLVGAFQEQVKALGNSESSCFHTCPSGNINK